MKIDLNKRLYLLQEKKINFSYKKLFFETVELYKKIFFFIFLNFFLYYILHEWFVQLAKNYTGVDIIFDELTKSIFLIKKTEQINYINLDFYYNLITCPQLLYYLIYLLIIDVLFFPLLIGIYEICLQFEQNKYVHFQSIFIGYLGKNFFNFIGLIILYTILKFLSFVFFLFPFILFFIFSIFSAPLMLFHSLSIKKSFEFSYKIVKKNFFRVFSFLFFIGLICILVSILFFFGIYFMVPFFYVGIYVLYKKLIGS